MKKLFVLALACAFGALIGWPPDHQAQVVRPPLRIQEIDGVPAGTPATLKVSNGSLTLNTDGSMTLTTDGSDITTTNRLIEIATSPAYQVRTVLPENRDVYGNALIATVVWPDGVVGTYTVTAMDATFPNLVDAWTVTHGGQTVTQGTIIRDSNGYFASKPDLTVSP